MSEESASSPEVASRPTGPDAAAQASFRKRTLAMCCVLLVVAAATMWASSRMTWATLLGADGLSTPRHFTVHGSDWSPWLTAVAIVLLAAIAAAASLRGWALRITAIIVAAIAVVSVLPIISLFTNNNPAAYAAKSIDLPGRYQVLEIDQKAWAAVVLAIGAIAALGAAVMVMRLARGGTAMSTKYTSPAARRAELERTVFAARSEADAPQPPRSERVLWDALDNGADPTDGSATASAEPTTDDPSADDKRHHDR